MPGRNANKFARCSHACCRVGNTFSKNLGIVIMQCQQVRDNIFPWLALMRLNGRFYVQKIEFQEIAIIDELNQLDEGLPMEARLCMLKECIQSSGHPRYIATGQAYDFS